MPQTRATTTLFDGVALLERAISYTLGSLQLVTCEAMSRPTPCADWDLRALLAHMNDSLQALEEAVDLGEIRLGPQAGEPDPHADPYADPVAVLRNRACRLLGEWTRKDDGDPISVGGCPVTTSMVTGAGAIEIAVHGWDVAKACERQRPLPTLLAQELLARALTFVTDADRPTRFAAAVDLPPRTGAGDRLLAFLGRHPQG